MTRNDKKERETIVCWGVERCTFSEYNKHTITQLRIPVSLGISDAAKPLSAGVPSLGAGEPNIATVTGVHRALAGVNRTGESPNPEGCHGYCRCR